MTLPFQHSAEYQMTVPLLLVSKSICILSYLQIYLDIETLRKGVDLSDKVINYNLHPNYFAKLLLKKSELL